ncbi:hypothetical protein PPYR_02021 [Photinus pyralis]|uniref:Uncharacterized protein n=2 Tax=Photinus pyralis TaxID=7054 RepID=A0A1Y1MU12_PHOPY|nr:UPF0160 protein [Photinus pyralis]KAB0805051.1 hypothetical protein PPYR_02021 [Photinus pyralis]
MAFNKLFLNYPITTATNIWKGFYRMASESKSPRLVQTIGTHSGIFHCDEALACFMLKQLPEYKDAEIVRTRDQSVLDTCDIVVDVGGTYNPKTNRFDHHQRSFTETLSTVRPDLAKDKKIKLSSAGLIYAHFGMQVLSEVLIQNKCDVSTTKLSAVYLHVYDKFIEEIDAIDNGEPICADGQQLYHINSHVSERVKKINPQWNSKETASPDKLFQRAMELVGGEFVEIVLEAGTVWWPGREIVLDGIENRNNLHASGQIIELSERCPWVEHLFGLENELGIPGLVKFVLFQDRDGSCRVQSVPIVPGSFICRNFLHEDWRGHKDDELCEISGINGITFCHHTGFIGGNKTKEGALEMAIKSLHSSV